MAPHCRLEGSLRSAGGAADEEPPSPSWSILRFAAPRSILWRVLLVPCAVCGAAGSMAKRMSGVRRSSQSAGWGKDSVEGGGGSQGARIRFVRAAQSRPKYRSQECTCRTSGRPGAPLPAGLTQPPGNGRTCCDRRSGWLLGLPALELIQACWCCGDCAPPGSCQEDKEHSDGHGVGETRGVWRAVRAGCKV